MKGHVTRFKKPAALKPWKKLILAEKAYNHATNARHKSKPSLSEALRELI